MSLILPDLTSDRSTTTGTGTYTLAGTPTDYAPFGFSGLADGTTVYYLAIDVDPSTLIPTGAGAEVGLGTMGGTGTTLARTTIHKSTNANAAVNWAAGTRLIQVVRPATGVFVFPEPGGSGTDEFSLDASTGFLSYASSSFVDLVVSSPNAGDCYIANGSNRTARISGGRVLIPDTGSFSFADGPVLGGSTTAALLRGAAGVVKVAGATSSAPATISSIPLSPAQITGDQNNYAPGVARFYRLSSDAARTITGLSVGQVDGQECEIWNVGSNNIVLANDSASSLTANQFLNSTGADITLAANEIAFLRWFSAEQSASGGWRVVKG